MITTTANSWKESILEARSRSLDTSLIGKFKGLHKEQTQRGAYFCELAKLVADFQLSNPFERSALSLEPTHPVQPSRMPKLIANLTGSNSIGKNYKDLKISLLSLPQVASFVPDSEVSRMLRGPFREPLYLLDPLYGFTYFSGRDGKFANHCLAIDFWQAHLESMPVELSTHLWKNRSDNMLSGGAFAARLLFSDIVPKELDESKLCLVPEIIVHSENQFEEVVSALREGAKTFPNIELWFRGQSKDYQTPDRSELLKHRITPYSNIQESDFTPSLYRNYDDSLEDIEVFENMLFEIAQWVEAASQLISDDPKLIDEFSRRAPRALSAASLTSFQRGLLLQQYGAPSAYLDITSDPMVAAWFATQRCKQSSSGRLTFNPYFWMSEDRSSWPTIFVFPLTKGLHPYLNLDSILSGSKALRPVRQSCGLLGGAGNLARNYCARYLGLKLRLHPSFVLKKPIAPSYFFPSPKEDLALAELIKGGFSNDGRRYPVTHCHTE
ncbi:FRG domain-containing protein [Oxalobacteraceae bacterium]|nr:FRG domain-containing protein [Oxalobacteraceae bacterium]